MPKFFNIAGPCYPEKHYMLPAQERCQGLLELIAQEQYFVIHAARQTGKTTLLLELARQLERDGQYHVLYCSLETAQGIAEPEIGLPAVIRALQTQIEFHPTLNKAQFAQDADYTDFTTILHKTLASLCAKIEKPLVILFDEVDCLSDGTLIGFLRQLRAGYVNRMQISFPQSVALVGMRNIRDYKARIRPDRETLGSASPFNIAAESLTLRNFTEEEVTRLYAQHAVETGQSFPQEATARVFHYTQGQPWLVNAIAREIVVKMLKSDATQAITVEQVEQAVETLILRRDTHLDSLLERLKEERVQKVVEPVIIGEERAYDSLHDDYRYVIDLGLLREADKKLIPANPMYAEVMIRTLSLRSQLYFNDQKTPPTAPAYLVNGALDMRRLLSDFQAFWREHSDIWIERYDYKEAAPHLIVQAFLQRVINGGGRITREMAAGSRRLDLCVHYQARRYPIELKLRYDQKTYQEGVKQLADYMETLDCAEGWLLVFDLRKHIAWKRKLFWKTETIGDKTIWIVGC